MASKNVLVLNDMNFESEIKGSDQPVLVDFTATWCGPCKMLAPIVDQVADEFTGKYKVAKVDIDDSPDTAARYGIRGVPTVMVFKGGKMVRQHVGLTNKQGLLNLLNG